MNSKSGASNRPGRNLLDNNLQQIDSQYNDSPDARTDMRSEHKPKLSEKKPEYSNYDSRSRII
jgi:hypothetical protein